MNINELNTYKINIFLKSNQIFVLTSLFQLFRVWRNKTMSTGMKSLRFSANRRTDRAQITRLHKNTFTKYKINLYSLYKKQILLVQYV